MPRRSLTLEYHFDEFASEDEFLIIELSGSIDIIFGMPWLARHQPDVDWLNRTVKPRDIDVNAVQSFLEKDDNLWRHVTVMDPDFMTLPLYEESDGP